MQRPKIGFVGLGLMGSEMVKNLLKEGFSVIGLDVDQKKMDMIVKMGGKRVDTPDLLASQVNIVILSLPNSYVVNDVVRTRLKLLESGKEGLILIDMTTADPFMSENLATELRTKKIEMLDATISGGPKMFAERNVTIIVGGEERIFQSCKPVFSTLSQNILYVGKNGSGALMKLLVNLTSGLTRMALAEGLALCKRAGISQHLMLEVLRKSPHYSRSMEDKATRMIEKNFLPAAGKIAFHLKDVSLMLDLGRRLNFPLPLTSFHAQALTSEVAKGRGDWDNTNIISFYEDLANLC